MLFFNFFSTHSDILEVLETALDLAVDVLSGLAGDTETWKGGGKWFQLFYSTYDVRG